MNFEDAWDKALKHTEIVRSRIKALSTGSDTKVPYILLSESAINQGDTIVRKGEVLVKKPSLVIPPNNPQFSGFEFEDNQINENSLVNFFLVRGVSFPSFRYDNRTSSLDIKEGKLSEAVKFYSKELQQQENVSAGLMTAPEDVWQFALIIFICTQITRNVETDIRRLIEEYRKQHPDGF